MAGELIYFTVSLGNLLQQGRDNLDPAQVMAVMVVIIAISVVIENVIFSPIERRMRERRGLGLQRSYKYARLCRLHLPGLRWQGIFSSLALLNCMVPD